VARNPYKRQCVGKGASRPGNQYPYVAWPAAGMRVGRLTEQDLGATPTSGWEKQLREATSAVLPLGAAGCMGGQGATDA
jgi:hypothetical protein